MTDKFKEAQRLHTAGHFAEAQDLYVQVVDANPHDAEALYFLGTLLAQRGRFEKAEVFLRRAVQENPRNSVYHCNLGVILQNLAQLDRAKACFQRSLKFDDRNTDAYYNLGKLYKQLDLIDVAILNYEQVLSLDHRRADALINLGNIMLDLGRLDDAVSYFERAVEIEPEAGGSYVNLGNTYRRMGLAEEAIETYDRALGVRFHDGLRIKQALTLPVVYKYLDHIADSRSDLERRVQDLLADDVSVTDPSLETSTTNFFLAYQNRNDKELQKTIAALHLKSCPALSWTAPHCDGGARRDGKIRVGFLSTYFRRHSVGRMMVGLITKLPKDDFEIIVITSRGKGDSISRAIEAAADNIVYLPDDLFEARMAIGLMELDILFFADIGMDVRTYFLAFARMAPVQCMTWGHPDTSGIPNMDYFLSSGVIEPAGASAHYSEELQLLPSPPTCYPRPDIPGTLKSRTDLGLPDDKTLYLCPQSAIKFHPDVDALFAGVLRGDPKAVIYVIEGAVSHWTEQVRRRWQHTISNVEARIHVLPRQSPEDFIALQATADVILDTPHFSGGNTSYEAFTLGKPVVTLDSDFMRGRVTAGLYRLMEIDELTANTLDQYVEIALRLGTARVFRREMVSGIVDRRETLFDRQDVVDGFVKFAREVSRL